MAASQFFILIALVALAMIAVIIVGIRKRGPQKQPSRLATLAFLLVIAGIFFGEDRLIGYGLLGPAWFSLSSISSENSGGRSQAVMRRRRSEPPWTKL